jgi:hypothetical protein
MARTEPFLGANFRCCGVYARIYKNRRGDAYEGRCPKCGRKVRFPIDPARGTSHRFFDVY